MTTPIPSNPEKTPGGYMKACRQRAGLSIAEVGKKLAYKRRDLLHAGADLRRLEANTPGDYGRLVRALREFKAFPFDFATFCALAAETCSIDAEELAA